MGCVYTPPVRILPSIASGPTYELDIFFNHKTARLEILVYLNLKQISFLAKMKQNGDFEFFNEYDQKKLKKLEKERYTERKHAYENRRK